MLKDIEYYFIFGQGPDGTSIGFQSKNSNLKIKISRLNKNNLSEIENILIQNGIFKMYNNPYWE